MTDDLITPVPHGAPRSAISMASLTVPPLPLSEAAHTITGRLVASRLMQQNGLCTLRITLAQMAVQYSGQTITGLRSFPAIESATAIAMQAALREGEMYAMTGIALAASNIEGLYLLGVRNVILLRHPAASTAAHDRRHWSDATAISHQRAA